MIPIRDHNPSGSFPLVTYLLIAVNVLVFLYMFSLPPRLFEQFIINYALIPNLIINGQQWSTLVTSMFLHGGFAHIFVNMLFLNIFGDNLEDRLGHLKFFLFYIFCGIGASLLQLVFIPNSTIPNLGASGAVAGVMGGYLLLFPTHKIDLLLPWFVITTIPAFLLLLYWIGLQFFLGFGEFDTAGSTGGVAYFAHIGGFLAGFLMLLPFSGGLRNRGD